LGWVYQHYIISRYTGMMLTVDSEQSTVTSELEFTIRMLTDLILLVRGKIHGRTAPTDSSNS